MKLLLCMIFFLTASASYANNLDVSQPLELTNKTDNGVLKDAFGFMLHEGKGWKKKGRKEIRALRSVLDGPVLDGPPEEKWDKISYDINSCIVKISTPNVQKGLLVFTIDRIWDLNLVNWKSVIFQRGDKNVFRVECSDVCYGIGHHAEYPLDGYTQQLADYPYSLVYYQKLSEPVYNRGFSIAFEVAKDRFEAALLDVIKECPGIKSKY